MNLQRLVIRGTRPARYALDRASFAAFAPKAGLLALRGRHAGRPMLVVGNGPSLNDTPLDDFAGVPSVGMNKIDLIFPRTAWRPEAIVCLNNVVAVQHQAAFAASEIPVFVAWKARWLLGRQARRALGYYNLREANAFTGDPVAGFGSSATVTYIALQMAFWMGADPVILFGVDHSFSYSGPASTYQKREGADVNHFDPNYFRAGSVWATPDLEQSEADYRLARAAFEADGRRVLDATVGGKLTVFDKIGLDAARALAGV